MDELHFTLKLALKLFAGLILLGVWLFHVLYFIFGIRTLPENEGKVPITEAEEEF